jgi:8-oxo-dGTP pyrophosphatase MutT (NUDIX family)
VGQYRYPLDAYTWEIPEGGGDKDIPPVEAAKRELLEECGIIATDWTLIQELQLSNSATDEIAYLYVAKSLSFTESQPEEVEELSVRKIHFDALYEMVQQGKITDSLSVAAILKVKLMMLDHQL